MKRLIILISLFLIALVVFFLVFMRVPKSDNINFTDLPTNQIGKNNKNNFEEGQISVATKDGGVLNIAGNFNENDTILLATDFYKLFEPREVTDAAMYDIYYDQIGQTLLVTLHQEPIGEAREMAINSLMSHFGMNLNQLCILDISVITNQYVNARYSGFELGIPGCSGAVEL